MNTEYTRLAYELTVIAELRRHLMDKFLQGGGGPKETLVCERLPYDLREVPNEAFAEVIQRLEEEEKVIADELAKFDFRKKDVRPLARPKPVDAKPTAGRKGGKPRAQRPDAG